MGSHGIRGTHRMPCGVELSHADGADFLRTTCEANFLCISVISVCNDFWHKNKSTNSSAPFAPSRENFSVQIRVNTWSKFCVFLWVWDKIFDIRTKGHIFLLTQRRKVSQSVCAVLRRLRAIIFTRNPRSTQKSLHVFARIYSYFFEPWMHTNC